MDPSIRRRRRLQPNETALLTRIFEQYPRPNAAMRELLAQRLGMSLRGVQIWFQNKRAKVKRDLVESDKAMLLFAPTYPMPMSGGSDTSGASPLLIDELAMLPDNISLEKVRCSPSDGDSSVPSAEQLEKLVQEMIGLSSTSSSFASNSHDFLNNF